MAAIGGGHGQSQGVGMEDVLKALEAEEFPESRRRNVRLRGDQTVVEGMCLGITHHWTRGPWMSKATREHSRLAALLCRFAMQELPGVQFTSIQVNKDYRAALHVDKNNLGPSWIIGLGDYTGGRLWVDDGSRSGSAVDIRRRWFRFDGNRPHCVLPFRGRRYTVVLFTYSHPKFSHVVAPSWMQSRLAGLGFSLPLDIVQAPPLREYTPTSVVQLHLASARRAFKRFQARVLARGGVGRLRLRVADSDGHVHHVGILPDAPMRHLVDAFKRRIRPTVEAPCPAIRLAIGSLRLLPGDTAAGLGLDARQLIGLSRPAEMPSAQPSAEQPMPRGLVEVEEVAAGAAAGEELPEQEGSGLKRPSEGLAGPERPSASSVLGELLTVGDRGRKRAPDGRAGPECPLSFLGA